MTGGWKAEERAALAAAVLDTDTVSLMLRWSEMWNEGNLASLETLIEGDFRFNDVTFGSTASARWWPVNAMPSPTFTSAPARRSPPVTV